MLFKNEGRKTKNKYKILLFFVTVFLLNSGWVVNREKIVCVTVDNISKTVITAADTVGQFLKEQAITVGPEDRINLDFDYKLLDFEQNKLVIKKAARVTVEYDGETIYVLTYDDTVQQVLDKLGVKTAKNDKIFGLSPDSSVIDGMKIKIVRVSKIESVEIKYLPYETKLVENTKMLATSRKTIQEGEEGIVKAKYDIVMENGEIVSKSLVSEEEVKQAVTRVDEYGTLLQYRLPSGEVFTYSKVYDMKATAYTTSFEECNKTDDHPAYGITYSGIPVRKGIIAVDPKVIPLGTKVYIQTVGRGEDYGFSLAADIGTGVNGYKVDLYMEDKSTALQWGIRNVRVYILQTPVE